MACPPGYPNGSYIFQSVVTQAGGAIAMRAPVDVTLNKPPEGAHRPSPTTCDRIGDGVSCPGTPGWADGAARVRPTTGLSARRLGLRAGVAPSQYRRYGDNALNSAVWWHPYPVIWDVRRMLADALNDTSSPDRRHVSVLRLGECISRPPLTSIYIGGRESGVGAASWDSHDRARSGNRPRRRRPFRCLAVSHIRYDSGGAERLRLKPREHVLGLDDVSGGQ